MLAGRLPVPHGVRLSRSPLVVIGTAVLVLASLALAWYGAMAAALALKASPSTIDSLSGYQAAYRFLAGLGPSDITREVRTVAGLAGLAALLLFGFLVYKELPRGRIVRLALRIAEDDRGAVEVSPRVVEAVGATAAAEEPAVSASRARLADSDLELELALDDAPGTAADVLHAARRRALEAMEMHGLPVSRVHVTLTGYSQKELT
jgi:hypothetical protein